MLGLVDGLQLTGELSATSVHEKGKASSAGLSEETLLYFRERVFPRNGDGYLGKLLYFNVGNIQMGKIRLGNQNQVHANFVRAPNEASMRSKA